MLLSYKINNFQTAHALTGQGGNIKNRGIINKF